MEGERTDGQRRGRRGFILLESVGLHLYISFVCELMACTILLSIGVLTTREMTDRPSDDGKAVM